MKAGGATAALAGLVAIPAAFIAIGTAATGGSTAGTALTPSAAALSDIPGNLLPIYQAAAKTCPGESWTLLAGIGKIETDHVRSKLPGVTSGANSAGAEGPMQFLPNTWAAYGRDGDHDGTSNIYDPADAIYGAANYLCANGAGKPGTVRQALWAYNHSTAYADQVLAKAKEYGDAAKSQLAAPAAFASGPGLTAVAFARARLGLPYVWGGEGPDGFDCSGLAQASWHSAGVDIPRTADAQYRALGNLAEPQQPGDLVFFGTTGFVHHVGIYIGDGLMIDAPTFGIPIRIEPFRESDYLAAGRPS